MMKKVLFYSALILSILLVVWSFRHAYEFRGYDAVGGEWSVIVLPVALVWGKLRNMEKQIENLKERKKKLKGM